MGRLPTTIRVVGFIKITRDDVIVDPSIKPEEIDPEIILDDSTNYQNQNSKLETLWFMGEDDLPKVSAYSLPEILGISESVTVQEYYPKSVSSERFINGEIDESLITSLESEFWNNIVKPTFSTGLPDWIVTQLKWEILQRGSSDDILTYAKTSGTENFSDLEKLFGEGFIDRLSGVIIKAPGIVFKYNKNLLNSPINNGNPKVNDGDNDDDDGYQKFLIPPGVLLGLPLINPSKSSSPPRIPTNSVHSFEPIRSSLAEQNWHGKLDVNGERGRELTFGSLPISNTAFNWYLITQKDIKPITDVTRCTSDPGVVYNHQKAYYGSKKYSYDDDDDDDDDDYDDNKQTNSMKERDSSHISPLVFDVGSQRNVYNNQIILNTLNTGKRNVQIQEKQNGDQFIPKKYHLEGESYSYSPSTMVAIMSSRKKQISPIHDISPQNLSQPTHKNKSPSHSMHISNTYAVRSHGNSDNPLSDVSFTKSGIGKSFKGEDNNDDDDAMSDIIPQELPRIINITGNNDIQLALEILRDQKETMRLRCHYFTHHSNSLLSKYMDSFECNICASPKTVERWEVGGQKPGLLLCSENCYLVASELVNLLSSVTSNYDSVRRQLYNIQSKIDIITDNIKPLDVSEFKELTRLLIRVLLQGSNSASATATVGTIPNSTPDPIHRLYELREKRLRVDFSKLTKSMHYATQCPEKVLILSQDTIIKLVSQNVFFIQYPEAETRLCILADDPPQGDYELIDAPSYAPQFLRYWIITRDTSHLSINPLNVALIKGNSHHGSVNHNPSLSSNHPTSHHTPVVRSFTVTTRGIQQKQQHQYSNVIHYHREEEEEEYEKLSKPGSMGWRNPTSMEISKRKSSVNRKIGTQSSTIVTQSSHFIVANPQDMFLCSPGLRIASVDKSSIHIGHPLSKCNIGLQDELWEITRVQS